MKIEQLENTLKNLSTTKRIKYIFEHFKGKIIVTTSGGKTSGIILQLLKETFEEIKIPQSLFPEIIFLDTLFYTKKTYDQIKTYKKEFNITILKPKSTKEEIIIKYPSLFNDKSQDFIKFKKEVKLNLMNEFLKEKKPVVWITGLIGYKTKERIKMNILKKNNNILIFNPIIDWDKKQVKNYLNSRKILMNEDHFDITKGTNQKKECGLHSKELFA